MRTYLILFVLLFVGAGCSVRTAPASTPEAFNPPPEREQVTAPSIVAPDQAITDGRVILGPVSMTVDGWLVAYEDDGEKPGQILGHAYLYAGEYPEVNLPIKNDLYTGKVYIAPHYDRGTNAQFEFPGVDMPLEIDGVVPVTSFVVE